MQTYHFTAFMDDPDEPRPENPIHSTEGGRAYGYTGALVGGVTVYGWVARAFIDVLGEAWLRGGWAEVSFRRPVYAEDEMTVTLEDSSFRCANENGENCLIGQFGMGSAPWTDTLTSTNYAAGSVPNDIAKPALMLATAPVGADLKSLVAASDDMESFLSSMRESDPRYLPPANLLNPAWIAGQMTRLLHHSYEYGPAIHAQSQIQNYDAGQSSEQISVTGHCVRAYERKGHHYIVNDGSVWAAPGRELTRIRHTAIFRVRPPGSESGEESGEESVRNPDQAGD